MRLIHDRGVKLMLSLFKSKRHLRLLENEKMLSHYLTVIKELSDAELARGLDMAAEIKYGSLESVKQHTDHWNAFISPVLLKEKKAERIQAHWVEKIMAMHEKESAQAELYASGMSIWSHSLITATHPELRQQGLVLWIELQRGFKYCKRFDPQLDVPEVI